jgi:hypothetical protein
MADRPLSETSCVCGEPNCNSFDCCDPIAHKETTRCRIVPLFEEVCIDYGDGEEYVDTEFIHAILVDATCGKVIITQKCQPLYVRVKYIDEAEANRDNPVEEN